MLVLRGEVEEPSEPKETTTDPKHALICKTRYGEAIFFSQTHTQEDDRMPRIIWIILIIVIFGAATFFLRRYMER